MLRPHWTPRIGGEQMAGQALGRFALQRLGQDTQDTHDSQDCAYLVRKLASHFLARKPFTSAQACPATILGVLGVLSVLARPPEDEIPSGRHAHPQWHSLWPAATDWARRHLAAHD